MLLVILLVCFVVVMLLWGFSLAGALSANSHYFAFAAVLILGIVVFLYGTGVIVLDRPAVR